MFGDGRGRVPGSTWLLSLVANLKGFGRAVVFSMPVAGTRSWPRPSWLPSLGTAVPGGYQVGNFPPGWMEWNDKFRDVSRAFWKGDDEMLGDFAKISLKSGEQFNRAWPKAGFISQFHHRARRVYPQ